MNNNNFDYEEIGRDALHNKAKLDSTGGLVEHEARKEMEGVEPREYNEPRIKRLVAAAINHAEEEYKNMTLITSMDITSLKTWPNGERINPEDLKDMIRANGGRLDIMVDRECEDMETGEPMLNDNSPLSLRGAEYEQGELILITTTNVYATVNFNDFEYDRSIDAQAVDREW